MGPLTSAALVVMGVGLLAWLLRRTSGSEGIDRALLSGREPGPGSAESSEAEPEPEMEPEAADDAEEWLEGELAPRELLAITSTGEVFLPYSGGVHVLALGEARERIATGVTSWENVRQEVVDALRIAEGTGRLSTQFSPGDFTAGRVRRGAPGTEPWRLELLGRDGEYIAFVFETEEAARTALAMLERGGTIHRPVDEGGEPVPASAEDFEEARRRYDEAVAELATMPEEDEEDPPGSPPAGRE
jgi:hypothetical protein